MEGESWAQALFRFQSGVIASFDALLHASPVANTEDFRITGSGGEIVIEHGREGRLLLFNAANPEGKTIMQTFPGKVDSYGAELHDFSLAVLDGKALEASPEFSLGELRTAKAMYRSGGERAVGEGLGGLDGCAALNGAGGACMAARLACRHGRRRCCITITTTHRPATDLGYLLHKHGGAAAAEHVVCSSATSEAVNAYLHRHYRTLSGHSLVRRLRAGLSRGAQPRGRHWRS